MKKTQEKTTGCSGNINLAAPPEGEEDITYETTYTETLTKFKGSQSRAYVLTIWNDEERDTLQKMKYKYLVIGEETCPTTKKKHYQCYIYFENTKKWLTLKKKLTTAYIHPAKGNGKQNRRYCTKESTFFEDGKVPGEKLTSKEIVKMTDEELIDYDARCHQAYIKAKTIIGNKLTRATYRKKVKVFYIWGPSGAGKTEYALDEIIKDNEFCEVNYLNGFYNGINTDCKILLYDEWRDNHMKPSELISLIDYNVHNINIKGGTIKNRFETIIITTVQDPKTIYSGMIDQEPKKQWERRMEFIHIE